MTRATAAARRQYEPGREKAAERRQARSSRFMHTPMTLSAPEKGL
jgi:hypothetical protein